MAVARRLKRALVFIVTYPSENRSTIQYFIQRSHLVPGDRVS